MNSLHNAFKNLRLINLTSALKEVSKLQPKSIAAVPKLDKYDVNKTGTVVFTHKSIGFEIAEKPVGIKIHQDPLIYIPIINPLPKLPPIDSNWHKDEISLPTIEKEEKQAVRLIVIRRKKMKKHQKNKLWKRMRHRWARTKKRRKQIKEKVFQNELVAIVKAANEFSAEKYVMEKLEKGNENPLPTHWRHKRLPEFIIRQLMGIDKKINYKHTDKYKA